MHLRIIFNATDVQIKEIVNYGVLMIQDKLIFQY